MPHNLFSIKRGGWIICTNQTTFPLHVSLFDQKASVELVFEDLESLDLGMEPIEVNTAAVPTRPIPVFPSGHSIGIKTAKALRELLFGSAKAPSFSEEWRRQDFVFSDHPQLRYGLIQHKVSLLFSPWSGRSFTHASMFSMFRHKP